MICSRSRATLFRRRACKSLPLEVPFIDRSFQPPPAAAAGVRRCEVVLPLRTTSRPARRKAETIVFGSFASLASRPTPRKREWLGESQQVSPTRAQHFGTEDLNRLIQREYKGGLIVQARNPRNRFPRPFGEQEIVWTEKVIQVVNQSINGWPRKTGLDYVANGEIGIVRNANKGSRSDYVDIVFSTQTNVSYRYFGHQVGDNLELAYALTVHTRHKAATSRSCS